MSKICPNSQEKCSGVDERYKDFYSMLRVHNNCAIHEAVEWVDYPKVGLVTLKRVCASFTMLN
jgi:hypothetical protein